MNVSSASINKAKKTMKNFVKQTTDLDRKPPAVTEAKTTKVLGKAFVEGTRSDLKMKKEHAKNAFRDEVEKKRAEGEMLLKQLGAEKAHRFVLKPEYAFDERLKIKREVNQPPESLFMAIGFNQTAEDDNKQYRRFYPDELENIDDMMGSKPFNEFDVLRGASRGNKPGLFSGIFSTAKTDDSG